MLVTLEDEIKLDIESLTLIRDKKNKIIMLNQLDKSYNSLLVKSTVLIRDIFRITYESGEVKYFIPSEKEINDYYMSIPYGKDNWFELPLCLASTKQEIIGD